MKYATTIFLVLLSLCSQAQTKTWDGGAGTNNWEDANNWNPNGVPGILNDVEIDNDSVSVNANQTVKSILLESTHATETKQAIFLQNGITLSIFNSSNSGIEMNDEARFWNAGNLIISNVASAGIYILSGVFENMANQGFINVSLCQQGINNLGTFQNRNNAEISISDNSDIGVYNAISGSQFSNRGSITVSDGSIGLHNSGTLLNRGDITLEKIGYIGMITLNYLKNHASGTIKLDTLYDEGLFASYDFINEGVLSINSAEHNGLEDTFYALNLINSGSISISNTKENGIHIDTTGSVIKNLFGGVITIDSSVLSGIYSKQILINEGEINANNIGRDGIEFDLGGDTLINKGTITIQNTDRYGISHEGSYFLNEGTGVINLDTLGATGLLVSSKFMNQGDLNIKNAAVHGIYNSLATDSLINNGTILIETTGAKGLEHRGELFINNSGAELAIDSTVGTGFEVYDKFINEGNISIKKTGNHGLHNFTANTDSLINNGSIIIQYAGGMGIRHQGLAFLNGPFAEIELDTIFSTAISVYAKFINEGNIKVEKSNIHGFYSDYTTDPLINNGRIVIQNVGGTGFLNSALLFINKPEGEIKIDGSVNNGIEFRRKIINDGSIVVKNTGKSGLIYPENNSVSLVNNGFISIQNSGEYGINTHGSGFVNGMNGEINIDSSVIDGFYNNSKFINDGTLTIKNAQEQGLSNDFDNLDSLINNGSIIIQNAAKNGINHEGKIFLNSPFAAITIDSSGQSGFYVGKKLINEGNIEINNSTSIGLNCSRNPDSLINIGQINIYNSGDDGLFTGDEGRFLNTSSGIIEIDSSGNSGLSSESRFINEGTLLVFNSTVDGINISEDTLINNGLISIINAEYGIEHDGLLILNGSSGEIVIDTTIESGFNNDGKFINEGSLSIKNSDGFGLENSDSLINSGQLNVQNSNTGILHSDSFFFNKINGVILVDSTVQNGFEANTEFLNEGSLHIKNFGTFGLVYNSYLSDTLKNNGFIEIDDSGLIGITNHGNLFLNENCGRIKLEGIIQVFSPFLNQGLIVGPKLSFSFNNSNDSLVNDGTMYILKEPNSPYFINNGNLLYPFKGTLSDGIKEMNVVTVGASPSHPIPIIWWADEAKTIAAGTYDNVDKSFTPNAAGVSADTLWMELNSGSCAIMASIPANQVVNCNGSLFTATFTGAVSSDWHTPENWDIGIVPEACTIVIIPTSLSCTIISGRKARAHRIETESGSVFDAELGVVLDVNPEN